MFGIIQKLKKEEKMKKIFLVFLAVLIVFVFMSCSTVKVATPNNSFAYLMPDQAKWQVKEVRSKMNFYILWGLIPLGDNSSQDLIRPKEKVRVTTSVTIVNWILNCIIGCVTLSTNTTEVEVIK